MLNEEKAVIWDWNGTLLNDRALCVNAINSLLQKRNLEPISEALYQSIFTFPVKDYYLRAGFKFENESFEDVAVEFIDFYKNGLKSVDLFVEAREVLSLFKKNGYRQFIISAMKHDFLKRLIDHHDISDFFEEVSGIQDHLANGKDEMADGFIQKLNLNPKQLLWIGDTLHDYEIAERLGIESILVSNGHQSADRLKEATENVFANLWEVAETVLKTELKNENS